MTKPMILAREIQESAEQHSSILLPKISVIPPSTNQLYAGKARRFPSKQLKDFKAFMREWALVNRSALRISKTMMDVWIDQGDLLICHFSYILPHKRVWTKDGRPQRWDTSNHIKAVEDSVLEALGIDDKYAATVLAEKRSLHPEHGGSGWTTVRIKRIKRQEIQVEPDGWSLPQISVTPSRSEPILF